MSASPDRARVAIERARDPADAGARHRDAQWAELCGRRDRGFDLRAQLFKMCGVDLTRIDGIDVTTALAVSAACRSRKARKHRQPRSSELPAPKNAAARSSWPRCLR